VQSEECLKTLPGSWIFRHEKSRKKISGFIAHQHAPEAGYIQIVSEAEQTGARCRRKYKMREIIWLQAQTGIALGIETPCQWIDLRRQSSLRPRGPVSAKADGAACDKQVKSTREANCGSALHSPSPLRIAQEEGNRFCPGADPSLQRRVAYA
jgi:hypothetical protein